MLVFPFIQHTHSWNIKGCNKKTYKLAKKNIFAKFMRPRKKCSAMFFLNLHIEKY